MILTKEQEQKRLEETALRILCSYIEHGTQAEAAFDSSITKAKLFLAKIDKEFPE